MPEPQIVRLTIEHGKTGLVYAYSNDMPGLLVAERNVDDLRREVPCAAEALLKANGRQFNHVFIWPRGE